MRGASRAGFRIDEIGEYAPDARFASRYRREEKYVGWRMLVVLQMTAAEVSDESHEG